MTNEQSIFITDVAKYVQKYASSYGIKVHSPIIAQAILESGWGKTTLASKYHNYFGMKCGTAWTGKSVNLSTKEEYTTGVLTTIKDNFRVYDSMDQGIKGYFEFISKPRYANLKGVTDPQTYLQNLKNDGYATDSFYVSKNMNVITVYGLAKYDTAKEATEMNYDKYINSTGTHYISNSGSDENGNYHGGQAGDQTGNEWCLRSWYNRPWKCVLRYEKDSRVGQKLAELGCAAALNNKIGYDQYQRDSYWTQLKSVGYDPSKISTACESDCSAGVIANTKAVGYLLGITALQNINATYTGNMRTAYKNAGFTVLTDNKYLSGYDYLLPGDILLNDAAHTATNVTKGSKAEGTANNSTTTSPLPSTPNKTTKHTGKVTANKLNIRKGAGASYGTCSFSPLLKGTEVNVCDEISTGDEKWYYIQYNEKYGYVSAKYVEINKTTASSFEQGKKYALLVDNYIRTAVSGGYTTYENLSDSVKKKVKQTSTGKVMLLAGNTVQAIAVTTKPDGDVWIQIKSGWLCARHEGVDRLKACD